MQICSVTSQFKRSQTINQHTVKWFRYFGGTYSDHCLSKYQNKNFKDYNLDKATNVDKGFIFYIRCFGLYALAFWEQNCGVEIVQILPESFLIIQYRYISLFSQSACTKTNSLWKMFCGSCDFVNLHLN